MQKQAGEGRQSEGFLIRHGQHARQPQAHGTHEGVRTGPKRVGTSTPHLGAGLELNVRLEADDGFVIHGEFSASNALSKRRELAVPSIALLIGVGDAQQRLLPE